IEERVLFDPLTLESRDVIDQDENAIDRKRLFNEVPGSELDGFDCRFNRSMTAHNDELDSGKTATCLAQHLDSIHRPRHPDIEKHDIWTKLIHEPQAF